MHKKEKLNGISVRVPSVMSTDKRKLAWQSYSST